MNWFYVLDKQQCGPVSEAQLDELLRSGIIGGNTLVWRSGQAEWQPISTVRSSPSPGLPPIITSCIWRTNHLLVLRKGTPLPDRCVRCNGPANGFRLKRKLYWHHPVLYLLILTGILVYVVAALCLREKALIHIGLCETHRIQRKWFVAGSWLAVLIGLAMLTAGIVKYGNFVALGGFILFAGGVICGCLKGAVVSPSKIDKQFVWLSGVSPAFLAELQEWIGAPKN